MARATERPPAALVVAAALLTCVVGADGVTASPSGLQALRAEHERLQREAKYAEAQETAENWVSLAEKEGDAAAQVEALRAAASSYRALRQRDPEAAHLRRALQLAERMPDRRVEVEVLIQLARAEAERSAFAECDALLDRAEAAWRRTGIRDPKLEARLWSTRGVAATYQRDPNSALVFHQKATDLFRETNDRELLGLPLTNLGQVQANLHDYSGCLVSLQEALTLPMPESERPLVLISEGICHFELNQFDEAERLFEEGRSLAEKIGSRPLVAFAIGELGLVAWRKGNDLDRAMELFEDAAARCVRDGDYRNRVNWLANQAAVRRDQKRCEESLAIKDEILRQTAAVPGLRVPPAVLKNAAECMITLGRFEEADRTLAEALDAARTMGDDKRVWQGEREVARLRALQNRREDADRAYQRALDALEKTRGGLRLEAFKTDFFSDKVQIYEDYAAFLVESPAGTSAIRRSFDVAERSRARAFLDILMESRVGLHETLPPEIVTKEAKIEREISRLQAELRRLGDDPARAERLAVSEKELAELTLRVRTTEPRFRDTRFSQPVSLTELQASITPEEAVLAYMLAEPRSHLWIVRKDRVDHRRLPARTEIETSVRKALTGLLSPAAKPDGLATLTAQLLSDLSPEDLPRSLIIVPSGLLYYFPFEILPLGGDGRVLADYASTAYVPSATTLVALRQRDDTPSRTQLLALGDALYSGEAGGRGNAGTFASLGALPHTREEVRRVRSLFGRGQTVALLGQDATEGRLKAAAPGSFSVLHLAVHGWLDDVHPARSGLVLGREEGDEEDGLLQLREIFRLPLEADLVVLSACRSALGELVTGEGMVGLTRGFFHAGASSVVASLWNVDDEASAVFMDAFYRGLRRGHDKAEALRLAKVELRSDPRYAHPYYWAPFVLLGRGETTLTFPPQLMWWYAGGGVAVIVGLGFWLGSRRRTRR